MTHGSMADLLAGAYRIDRRANAGSVANHRRHLSARGDQRLKVAAPLNDPEDGTPRDENQCAHVNHSFTRLQVCLIHATGGSYVA